MEEQQTCGKGLAAHSVLPQKLSELIAAMAGVLEFHMTALDLSDDNARTEHDAYTRLAKEQRQIADQLQVNAGHMAGYRDLPMGRHDMKVMTGRKALETFENFVTTKEELLELLQQSAEQDQKMLAEMRTVQRGG